jgi:predicted small secreted protein
MMMKRIAQLMACCLVLSGCGNTKAINGTTYDVYGLANMSEKMNPGIEYEVSLGSVIVAVIFSETIIVPIYIVCFDLWQPVGTKPSIVGQVVRTP